MLENILNWVKGKQINTHKSIIYNCIDICSKRNIGNYTFSDEEMELIKKSIRKSIINSISSEIAFEENKDENGDLIITGKLTIIKCQK